jgi:putative endonuclease
VSQEEFYVYILTNRTKSVLYVGVTNNLERCIKEHWERCNENSFTSKYKAFYLIYYEVFQSILQAIAREKEIKGWRREKKLQLIKAFNARLDFLNKELFGRWPL